MWERERVCGRALERVGELLRERAWERVLERERGRELERERGIERAWGREAYLMGACMINPCRLSRLPITFANSLNQDQDRERRY